MNYKDAYQDLFSRLEVLITRLEADKNDCMAGQLRALLEESEKIRETPPIFRPGRASRRGSTMEQGK